MTKGKGGKFKVTKAEPKSRVSNKAKEASESAESSDDQVSSSEDFVDKDSDDDEGSDEDEESDVDSDDLDDVRPTKKAVKKRKSVSQSGSSPAKKSKTKDDRNLRQVEQAPKVPAPKTDPETSIILPTTMKFLSDLKENNDRDWFHQHDARYRHALANWTSFIKALVPVASEADWTLPELPPKDLLHRIYRDVRFSPDKSPYKRNLAASLSRTGRKGPYALYYIQISPGGNSLLAAGKWQPDKNELATIRHNIIRAPQAFRKIIGNKDFVKLFGEPKPKGPGKRNNVFGHEDELKNCPKMPGVTKDHPHIDLLKLRSVAVVKEFTDEQVLSDDFIEQCGKVMTVMAPFVQYVNEMLVPTPRSDDDEDNNDEDEEAAEEEEDDEDEDEEEDN